MQQFIKSSRAIHHAYRLAGVDGHEQEAEEGRQDPTYCR
jgi:hypothetical protein